MKSLKKAIGLFLVAFVVLLATSSNARAQGGQATSIRNGSVLPTCNSATLHYVFNKTGGSNPGFYLCTSTGWVGFTAGAGNQCAFYDSTGLILLADSRCSDNGTTFIYTGSGGVQSPSFTSTGSAAAGALGLGQGPANSAGQCGNPLVNCIGWQAPTAVSTNGWFTLPPAPTSGVMLFGAPSSGAVPGSTSGDSNHSTSVTGQTASIATTNLCPASAGGCNSSPLGMYVIAWTIRSSVSCATPGPAGITLTLGWTDDVGAKTFIVPQTGTGSSGTSVALGSTSNFGQGQLVVTTTGAAAITYATTYAACTSGTATYALELSVVQVD